MIHNIIPRNESGAICAEANLCREAIDEGFGDPTGGRPGAVFIRTTCCGIHPRGGYCRPRNPKAPRELAEKYSSSECGDKGGQRKDALSTCGHTCNGQVSPGQLLSQHYTTWFQPARFASRSRFLVLIVLSPLYLVGSIAWNIVRHGSSSCCALPCLLRYRWTSVCKRHGAVALPVLYAINFLYYIRFFGYLGVRRLLLQSIHPIINILYHYDHRRGHASQGAGRVSS